MTQKHKYEFVIVGAGGHAKVVLSTALSSQIKITGFVDDNEIFWGKKINDYLVLGGISCLEVDISSAVLGLGDNSIRKLMVERYSKFNKWKTLVHPHAYVHPSVKLGKGTVVFAGAIIQPDATIGDHCIINTGVTIDHDCIIDNFVHLAPGVHLAGGVEIEEGAFLGIGSVVIPQVKIGYWSQVAAGAVVVKNIDPKKKVMGIPAKEYIAC